MYYLSAVCMGACYYIGKWTRDYRLPPRLHTYVHTAGTKLYYHTRADVCERARRRHGINCNKNRSVARDSFRGIPPPPPPWNRAADRNRNGPPASPWPRVQGVSCRKQLYLHLRVRETESYSRVSSSGAHDDGSPRSRSPDHEVDRSLSSPVPENVRHLEDG